MSLLLSVSKSESHAAPASTVEMPEATAQQWVLKNGLTLIVREDRAAPVASVQAWINTGSIHEDKWLGAGLSHILEHMLFKGTEKRTPNAIAQSIQAQGGYINAYTTYDRTVYWIDVPASGATEAIDILADAMLNSTLPVDEYTKEQEVIRREFAMGFDDPGRMSSQLLFRTAYREHPYRHPIIGHLDVYNQLTRDDVMEYYKKRYVPNNMTFVVVGDVDAKAVHAQLEVLFASTPRGALEPVFLPSEPRQLGKREAHEEFATELTRLNMAWHIPGVTHPDMPVLDVLSTLLGDGRSSILYQEVREKLGFVHSISAYAYTPSESGLFGVSAVTDPDKRAAVESAVIEILANIRKNGVTTTQLEKAGKLLLAGQIEQLTSMRGQASDLGINWMLTGNLNFGNEYRTAVQQVTSADIQRVIGTYLTPDNLTVTSLNPVGSLAAIKKAAATENAAPTIEKFTLSNGLRVLVREDKRLPLVNLVAVFEGGLLGETEATNGVGRLMARTMIKGTKTRSASVIAEAIESVGGTIDTESGNNSFGVQLQVLRPDLPLAVDMLGDVLRNPTFSEEAIAREKTVQISGIKAEDDEMNAATMNLLRKTMFPGHPYGLRANGSIEGLQKLQRADVVDAWKRIVTAKNGVVAVFGDVTVEEVRKTLEKALAGLPEGVPILPQPPQPAALVEIIEVEQNKPKSQAVLMVGFPSAPLDSPDRTALALIDEASSDLASRFFIKIREEMGLAYFVGSSQLLGRSPGAFLFYVGTDPAKVDEVRAALLAEIKNLADNGLTDEELARAKSKLLGSDMIRNQGNATLAYACALDELYGLGAEYYLGEEARVAAVTSEQIREVAKKYFVESAKVIALTRPKPGDAPAPETAAPAEAE